MGLILKEATRYVQQKEQTEHKVQSFGFGVYTCLSPHARTCSSMCIPIRPPDIMNRLMSMANPIRTPNSVSSANPQCAQDQLVQEALGAHCLCCDVCCACSLVRRYAIKLGLLRSSVIWVPTFSFLNRLLYTPHPLWLVRLGHPPILAPQMCIRSDKAINR